MPGEIEDDDLSPEEVREVEKLKQEAFKARNRKGRVREYAETNVPDRFELFTLAPGEQKLTEETDTREFEALSSKVFDSFAARPSVVQTSDPLTQSGVPSTSIFTFNKEDHTLGNMIVSQLNKSSHVQFAGYRVPHPLFSTFEMRIQTDGDITPRAALVQACKDLVQDLSIFSSEFTKEVALRKLATETANDTR